MGFNLSQKTSEKHILQSAPEFLLLPGLHQWAAVSDKRSAQDVRATEEMSEAQGSGLCEGIPTTDIWNLDTHMLTELMMGCPEPDLLHRWVNMALYATALFWTDL